MVGCLRITQNVGSTVQSAIESIHSILDARVDARVMDDRDAGPDLQSRLETFIRKLPIIGESATSVLSAGRACESAIESLQVDEVALRHKVIEGMQPQINDMERRLGIMQS